MSDEAASKTPLQRAIEAAGSQAALAAKIEVTQQAISYWRTKGSRVPAEYVVRVEAATGISRHELRPDIFGPAQPLGADPTAKDAA